MPLTFIAPIEHVPEPIFAAFRPHDASSTSKALTSGSVPLQRTAEVDRISSILPMTGEQAEKLRRLAEAAYELDAFKSKLSRAEADRRIATLTAKLKLLDGPPHTL